MIESGGEMGPINSLCLMWTLIIPVASKEHKYKNNSFPSFTIIKAIKNLIFCTASFVVLMIFHNFLAVLLAGGSYLTPPVAVFANLLQV